MIRTVCGDVRPENVGATLCHEHLLMTGGWPVMNTPDYRLDRVDYAINEVTRARKSGLASVVEMTPNGFGRSPDGLVNISEATGLNIIAATGLHKVSYYADNHWVHHYSVEEITSLLVSEVNEGMDINNLEGPLIRRSTARAGVVKIATSYHSFGRSIRRFLEAVASTHLSTGVPIATHNDKGTMGHELLDALVEHGVKEDAVLLSHIDHNPDPVYLAELASRGAYLVFDKPGRIKYAPDSLAVELVTQLVGAGHGHRIVFGSDLARRSYWPDWGGGPGLTYLFDRFFPRLQQEGLGSFINQALVSNPAQALSFHQS
jgi:predicted metal-dependent phosphotriesterase family hydrolase